MFEKEAEKCASRLCCTTCKALICEEKCECWIFAKKGAELGYNKANEWHYPSKGEYPKEYKNVLCYCKVVDVKFYNVGHTIIGGDNKIRWWSSDRSEKLRVYAWKEITPPKEIKENEN